MSYKDYFSGHSKAYASARPTYPESLYVFLRDLCQEHELAWDCACGNGQASIALAQYFDKVVATDASGDQLSHAPRHPKVHYQIAKAENGFLSAGTVDLVTVAQALHWFDLQGFYSNVRTVLKTNGVLAVWCYGLHRIDSSIDEVIDHFYEKIVGPYWPKERRLIEAAYQDVDFPFQDVSCPELAMTKLWSVEEVMNYLESWSAVQRFITDRGSNPLDLIKDDLISAWGETPGREVCWPLTMRVGVKE